VVRDPAAVSGALGRLQAAITRLPANDWQKGIRAAEASAAPATLAVIRDALRSRRKVRIRYRAGGDEAPTERTIAPHATALASGAWYVVAYCDRSEGLRFFRADRIEAADATEQSIGEERVDVGALLASGRAFAAEAATAMTVRYSPRIARWIAEREGHPLAADGSLTMEHPVADTDWAMRHVLQYGPDAEVVAPDTIREAIAERLDEMRRAIA